MVYESSYESGRKPFLPDTKRGYWAAPTDFIYACLGFALKLQMFNNSWMRYSEMGIASIVPYLICLGLFIVPLIVMQSFMGQFSSSGFISAFRVSPLFKGMGYISLGVNLCILTFYSMFAAVPLLFLINSFRPTLPWSCEASDIWAKNISERYQNNICNQTFVYKEMESSNLTEFQYVIYHIPGLLYFRTHFSDVNFDEPDKEAFSMSWQLVGCNFLCWGIVAFIFYKLANAEKLGILLRYGIWLIMALMLICLTRIMFLPGAFEVMKKFFIPTLRDLGYGIPSIPLFAMSAFGPGWGVIISLASFNKFKTNIMRYSWIIGLGQMLIFIGFSLMTFALERHIRTLVPSFKEDNFYAYIAHEWTLYFSSATSLASMEWANFWCILYYTMMTLAALVVLVTQILSILVSTFDEFEALRAHKTEVTFGLIGILALVSLYFCSSDGVLFCSVLSTDAAFTQICLCLLLLLVILWVYGRERFQRDIQFMLGQPFSTWKVNTLRFVSPFFMCLVLLFAVLSSLREHFFTSTMVLVTAIILIGLPWFCIPGYAIFHMLQSTGSIVARFKRCCRPTDWYPVEAEERQRYEEVMGNLDITYQLEEVPEEVH